MRYIDSSVVLRIILDAPAALSRSQTDYGVTSALTEVECFRTLDRLRIVDHIPLERIASREQLIKDALTRLEIIRLSSRVLARAAQSLPVPLKTLDAIHLASAMIWRETRDANLDFATHDTALANAARAAGFAVIGA